MGLWKEILRRIAYLGRRGKFDRELDAEIRFHLSSRAQELEDSGLSHADAVMQARQEFGSCARTQEDTRSAWQFRWLEDLFTDLRHALRAFLRNRAFTFTALVCLALGIGANTLIFSLVNAILLRPLPYPQADRLVMVRFTPPDHADQRLGSNPGSYFFLREHNRSFEKMGAIRIVGTSAASDTGDASNREWVQEGWISPGLQDVLGVQPMLGRWFAQDPSGYGRVVISYGLWQRLYGGSPEVIGKQLRFDQQGSSLITGVMPKGFQTLNPDIQFWRFQGDDDLARARRSPNRVFYTFARLKPGVTVQQAQADVNALASPLGREYEMNRGWGIKIDTLRDAYFGHLRQPLLILQGAVLFLLLIACANVAGLLLTQASIRQKELAVRAALGSSRGRVIRQLLAESALLGILGGVAGAGLAWVGLEAIGLEAVSRVAAPFFPQADAIAMDGRVLGFALLLSLATGLLFGGIPAFQISRPDLMEMLRESSRGSTIGGTRQRLRGAFVIVQVALALVLLAGAGLLTRSLLRLNLVRPGFDPASLTTFQVHFPYSLERQVPNAPNTPSGGLLVELSPRYHQLADQIREQIASLPGVESASTAMTPPLGGVPRTFNFTRAGFPVSDAEREAWTAEWYPISAGYLHTLKLPLTRGREFGAEDSATSRPVAIVNSALADRFFPHENPIGQQIQTGMLNDPVREIVGVAGDVRQNRYEYGLRPQMYVPRDQVPAQMDMTLSFEVLNATFIVRSGANPAPMDSALRKAVSNVDPSLAVTNVMTVEQYAAGQLQDLRNYAALLGIFAGISVLLSVAGLFGALAHWISQRTNEIGIRRALGAPNRAVLLDVLTRGLVLIGIGLALGLVVSLALTRVIQSFLWGVTATDPLTFAAVLLLMAAIGAAACYVPARRALKVDPVIALRAD
jgi:putative ABC transport system permease protein